MILSMKQETAIEKGDMSAGNAADHAADDAAAAVLLREVQDLLYSGQPRHAIAHIIEMTGVSREMASDFVSKLQNGVFGE